MAKNPKTQPLLDEAGDKPADANAIQEYSVTVEFRVRSDRKYRIYALSPAGAEHIAKLKFAEAHTPHAVIDSVTATKVIKP